MQTSNICLFEWTQLKNNKILVLNQYFVFWVQTCNLNKDLHKVYSKSHIKKKKKNFANGELYKSSLNFCLSRIKRCLYQLFQLSVILDAERLPTHCSPSLCCLANNQPSGMGALTQRAGKAPNYLIRSWVRSLAQTRIKSHPNLSSPNWEKDWISKIC